MSEKLTNEAVVDRAIASINGLRVDGGEVFLRDGQSTSIEVRDGAIENAITRGERGIGVRVLRGGHVGFAYSSDLSADGIEECVSSARDIAAVTEPDLDVSIATTKIESPDLGLYEAGIDDRSVADRTDVALAVERAAKSVDPRITGFRKTTYSDGTMTTILATTAGVRGSYRETYFSVGTSAVAAAGEDFGYRKQCRSFCVACRQPTLYACALDFMTSSTGRKTGSFLPDVREMRDRDRAPRPPRTAGSGRADSCRRRRHPDWSSGRTRC